MFCPKPLKKIYHQYMYFLFHWNFYDCDNIDHLDEISPYKPTEHGSSCMTCRASDFGIITNICYIYSPQASNLILALLLVTADKTDMQ